MKNITKSSPHNIVLASGSKHRAKLLRNAGVKFRQISPGVDERNVEGVQGKSAKKQAELLAVTKAMKVSKKYKSAWVIGGDQVLEYNKNVLHKPDNIKEAKKRLLMLSGKNHYLHSAVCLVNNQKVRFVEVDTSIMSMRKLTPKHIDNHLRMVGPNVLGSVGAYQIEAQGISLFQKTKGDYFSIIGLPMIPLLNALRKEGVIDA